MKPANLVLDLLRTYGRRGTGVSNLMETAKLFQVSENAMRVTLTRLTGRGLVEKVRRGHYRLAEGSDPITDFVEEWRLGEKRRRPWQANHFLLVHCPAETDKDAWVLNATGFRSSTPNFWMRPDNLSRRSDELRSWLAGMGLSDSSLIAEGAELSEKDAKTFLQLYRVKHLDKQYQALIKNLEASAKRLEALPKAVAMKESFRLGGQALQLLAKDPYLPVELQSPSLRQALWQMMLAYDEQGRGVWTDKPAIMPTDMTSYAVELP